MNFTPARSRVRKSLTSWPSFRSGAARLSSHSQRCRKGTLPPSEQACVPQGSLSGKHDDVPILEPRRQLLPPSVGRALAAGGAQKAQCMNGIGVFLTLAEIDCCSDRGGEQLGQAVRYLRTVWLALFPARAVPMKLRKLFLRCSADFQVRRAIGLPIDVLRDKRRIAAAILLGGGYGS